MKIQNLSWLFCSLFCLGALNAQDYHYATPLSTLAFGSCNRTDLDPKIWEVIEDKNPDVWVWLGDIVYTEDQSMEDLAAKYALQKKLPAYQKLTNQSKVYGVWDDHDFGKNDAGAAFQLKQASRELLFDFLDLPSDHLARKREGAYQSYCFGEGNQKVCLYLLDVRYFKEAYVNDPNPNQRYKKNDGTLLGEAQWDWLETQLAQDQATIHLFGGGIQFLSSKHPYEKWANFPKAQKRFIDLLEKYSVKNPIYLSGDRHIAEISAQDLQSEVKFYDITSSGLTHSYDSLEEEYNPMRISPLITHLNFGMLEFDWKKRMLQVQILNVKGNPSAVHNILF